jgi:hypothetical protein
MNTWGSIINYSNSIEEEIKERTALGIKAYYTNLKFFESRLVTKYSKLKLYRTVIRPIVTYASETWVLKETSIQKLLVFERKILRRIFGPTKENQIWRIKTNEELDKLIKHKNIVNYIKAQKLSWFGHVQRMSDTRTVLLLTIISCRARWLMPPDVPQPVRLIVLTLL